ncbi:ARID DNA-binding domain-containing protein [Tanacetum coccineum]
MKTKDRPTKRKLAIDASMECEEGVVCKKQRPLSSSTLSVNGTMNAAIGALQPPVMPSDSTVGIKIISFTIKNENHTYLIPGVHYAPEVTLNVLSINRLQQQGFEIIFEGDRFILEYMFKDKKGQNLDLEKMRHMHNIYMEDYYESLNKEKADKEGEMARLQEDTISSEIHTFYEFKKKTLMEAQVMIFTSLLEEGNKGTKAEEQKSTSQPYNLKGENVGIKIRSFTAQKTYITRPAGLGKSGAKPCKHIRDMLKKKIEEIETFNSSLPEYKYKKYNCFYCKHEGHIIKTCPAKIKDEAEHAQGLSDRTASRFILEYMFKDKNGQNLDLDKMRHMHNIYMEDYYESLDKEKAEKEGEMARLQVDTISSEINTFYEFVAYLNLIKNDEIVNKWWDMYREKFNKVIKWFYNHYLKRQLPGPIPPNIDRVQIHLFDLYKLVDCMGGYLSVYFGHEFGAIAEILRLTREDGEKIKGCYMNYLDIFTSYYKIATTLQIPTNVEEGSESLESYQRNKDRTGATMAVQKGKEKIEHFGIKLEEDTYCNTQQNTHYEQDKDKSCKGPSTSMMPEEEDSHGSTSDDFYIIA